MHQLVGATLLCWIQPQQDWSCALGMFLQKVFDSAGRRLSSTPHIKHLLASDLLPWCGPIWQQTCMWSSIRGNLRAKLNTALVGGSVLSLCVSSTVQLTSWTITDTSKYEKIGWLQCYQTLHTERVMARRRKCTAEISGVSANAQRFNTYGRSYWPCHIY